MLCACFDLEIGVGEVDIKFRLKDELTSLSEFLFVDVALAAVVSIKVVLLSIFEFVVEDLEVVVGVSI